MTEEQANKLLESLKEMNRVSEEYCSMMPEMMKTMVENVALKAGDKYLHYVERYARASFITRWWWKRKMEKARIALENAMQFAEKMNKIWEPNNN